MQGVPGAGPQIQLPRLGRRGRGRQADRIGIEFVCPLVRVVKNRIIEIVVEVQHRIGNAELRDRLGHVSHVAGVVVGHLDLGIQVLGEGCRAETAERQQGGAYLGIHRYFMLARRSSLRFSLSCISSSWPEGW